MPSLYHSSKKEAHHDGGDGWLTKRSVSVRTKLQEFSYSSRSKGKQKGSSELDTDNECSLSSTTSTWSQSDSLQCSSSSSTCGGSESAEHSSLSREASHDEGEEDVSQSSNSSTESSCILIDSQRADSGSPGPVDSKKLNVIDPTLSQCINSSTDSSCILIDSQSAESGPGPGPVDSKELDVIGSTLSTKSAGRFYRRAGPATSKTNEEQLEELDKLEGGLLESDDGGSDLEDYTPRQRQSVLEFLNERSLEEMCDIPGCSLVRGKLLTELRPFEDWSALVYYTCLSVCLSV